MTSAPGHGVDWKTLFILKRGPKKEECTPLGLFLGPKLTFFVYLSCSSCVGFLSSFLLYLMYKFARAREGLLHSIMQLAKRGPNSISKTNHFMQIQFKTAMWTEQAKNQIWKFPCIGTLLFEDFTVIIRRVLVDVNLCWLVLFVVLMYMYLRRMHAFMIWDSDVFVWIPFGFCFVQIMLLQNSFKIVDDGCDVMLFWWWRDHWVLHY